MQLFSCPLKILSIGIVILSLTLPVSADEAPPGNFEADESEAQETLLPLEELRTFTDIFDRIKKAYVEPVEDSVLLENAIKGMLEGLDPHSVYLEKEAFDDLQENTKGEFGGLGLEVEMEDGFVKVVSPIDDTPALKAGIRSQDLILKIDDAPVKGMSLLDAVNLMRGDPGTDITLTIAREGETKPLIITLTRDIIKVASIKSKSLEAGFGYIRITQFQVTTGDDLVKAIKKLRKTNSPLKGLVLDLRNNPGGVLNAAVEVSDAFLSDGLIVYTKGRLPNSELRYSATPEDPSQQVPVVVLINGGSASASEIVAGALQDHQRAVIMGTESFGKGSVQTVLPLNNERALKLTTARYYTPSGRSIQAEGITPDINIENAKVTALGTGSLRFKEADLKGHLEHTDDQKVKNKKIESAQADGHEMDLAETDFQLHEALNLLKGIYIINRTRK
ncbi:MAG: S41 family peptidase [Pseudomonadales bacterium]|nr:S41 family peptidase [Pseudomonadales bacterium]MCP5215963.1 S41 family peptidase [Pseudomonadales bacterium]